MLAAEAAFEALSGGAGQTEGPIVLDNYEKKIKESWVYEELYAVRNCKPSFHSPLGLIGGVLYSGFSTLITRGREPWTFKHHKADWEALQPAG